ncbi:MAG: AAA family ATPase, partial [Deltaproteobacteria bacterium]|nr:AAA family ATPase [Deltaproteobacteria bacterium]
RLQQWFRHVSQGERQILFVTGEPGIGKTTVVEQFLTRIRATGLIRIGRGHCVEYYGQGEAYMPILEAFVRLTREPGGARLLAILSRYAPTWLMQMPALLNNEEFAQLQNRTQGATPQRMLREMAEVLEVLTAERPFILVLEDLHWSDDSTIALLTALGQRQERAQLMVIGTYRPSELASTHPLRALKQELQLRDRWKELPLKLLTEQDVITYVTQQLPERPVSDKLAQAIYRRTEGNPLFMVNVVTALAEDDPHGRGAGRRGDSLNSQTLGISENLQQTIAQRVARLDSDDRTMLETASVAGMDFTAAVVATAMRKKPIEIEERCGELARRKHFIQTIETVEWPDGTVTEHYQFIHSLYQEALYERVTGGKRVELHQRIGECLEHGYHNRKQEVATELALHFERGKDFHRAVQYLGQAAETANQRCAYPEALRLLIRALDLLNKISDNPKRAQQEIMLRISLGMSLMATKGYAALEVKSAYDRARELCLQVGETPQLVSVLRGLAMFYYVRAELQTARAIAEQLLDLVQSQQDRALLIQASYGMGGTLFNLGELPVAYHYLQRTMLFYDSYKSESPTYLSAQDTAIYCLTRMSYVLWFLGYPDQALVKSQEGISLSQELTLPHNLAYTSTFAAGLRMLFQEDQIAQQYAEEATKLATEHEFPIWATMGQILSGSALVHQGMIEQGIPQIESGIATWRAIGAQISMPYFLSLLAEAYGKNGNPEKGLRLLAEALDLTNNTEERWWEAELHRMKGILTLEIWEWRLETHPSSQASSLKPQIPFGVAQEAEACFVKALDVAQRQEAKSLELRAAVSLARLKQRQGRLGEALPLLEGVYNWFTEGFGTADLLDAKRLLDRLREQSISGPLDSLRATKTRRKTASPRQPEAEAEPRVARSARG